MEETIFPPSPSWFLPDILATRRDGSVAYGSKNNIVILKSQQEKKPVMLTIRSAHNLRVTGIAFSPPECVESIQNSVVSCSEDGFVKLWKIDTLSATIGHKCHWEQNGEVGKIISIDWSIANPHYVVSAAENNSLVLWDTVSNSTIKYLFPVLGATVIRCCPYNEKIVAVGRKTGQICIISLSGKGDILYKLRGHDNKINSLSWCPIPFNVFKSHDVCEEFLLASACQNKEVFIWRAGSDGKCETKFQHPTSALQPRDSSQHGKIGNTFSYVALCWLDPYKIYLSSNFGELIYFDIKYFLSNNITNGMNLGKKTNKSKLQNFVKLEYCSNAKGIFAIAGSQMQGNVLLYKDINVDSDLKYPIQSNFIQITKKTECGKDETWEATTSDVSSIVWMAGQDRKLVACEFKSSKMGMTLNYNTINGTVYCAVVSPHDPNKLAIGAGDGMIRLWNLTEPDDIQVYWQKIKDRVMSLAWHPRKDGLLAYGTSEGRVGLVDTKSNKLPSVFKPSHPQPIYSLSWGPQFPSEDAKTTKSNAEFDLYTTGDFSLLLYNPTKLNSDPLNLSKIISFPCKKQTDVCWKPDYSLMAVGNDDGSICLVEPSQFKIVFTLLAYKKLIQSIAWHPSSTSIDSGLSEYNGYFTSGSTENNNEIRVFNCKKDGDEVKVEQVVTLKGHHLVKEQIQSVSWCPHVSCQLVSCSTDSSVQIWDVNSQTPLIHFIPSGMPVFSIWSPVDPDFVLTGCKNDVLYIWRVSDQGKGLPAPTTKTKKLKNEKNIQLAVSRESVTKEVEIVVRNSKDNEGGVGERKTVVKTTKEPKVFSQIWKGDASDQLKICYSLLKNEETPYSLPFLSFDEEYFNASIQSEEENLKKGNNWTELGEIALWKGNIKEVLEEKIKSGQLNDFLVSLAPTVSLRFWQEACVSYSKTLTEKKYHRKAASYLINCNKLYDAIHLLTDANFYLEALFIARSRLPKSDPMFEKIVRKYGEWLCKNGSFLKACQCFAYVKDYSEVAKMFGKTNHPEYLSLAALAAKNCGACDLESLDATNALFKCFETNNLELAQNVCNDHSNLKHLSLIFFVYHTMQQLEAGELELKTDILSHVKESFETSSVTFPSFLPKLFHKHAMYKSRRQVLSIVCQELCFAACAAGNEEIVAHVIKALSTSYRYNQNVAGEVHLSYKLCNWISPDGFLTSNSIFMLKDSRLLSKIKSLRAFLCACIVRHMSDRDDSSDVTKNFEILKELSDDLLDEGSCKYFKNLIDLKICEAEILEKKRNLSKRKVEEKGKTSGTAHEENNVVSCGKVNGDAVFEKDLPGSEYEVKDKEIENGEGMENGERDDENSFIGTKHQVEDAESLENDFDNIDIHNEMVEKNLSLLKRLKDEIDNFESERISSPHPLPVYAMLKKLCEGFPENESANFLLQNLEKKFRQIN